MRLVIAAFMVLALIGLATLTAVLAPFLFVANWIGERRTGRKYTVEMGHPSRPFPPNAEGSAVVRPESAGKSLRVPV